MGFEWRGVGWEEVGVGVLMRLVVLSRSIVWWWFRFESIIRPVSKACACLYQRDVYLALPTLWIEYLTLHKINLRKVETGGARVELGRHLARTREALDALQKKASMPFKGRW